MKHDKIWRTRSGGIAGECRRSVGPDLDYSLHVSLRVEPGQMLGQRYPSGARYEFSTSRNDEWGHRERNGRQQHCHGRKLRFRRHRKLGDRLLERGLQCHRLRLQRHRHFGHFGHGARHIGIVKLGERQSAYRGDGTSQLLR